MQMSGSEVVGYPRIMGFETNSSWLLNTVTIYSLVKVTMECLQCSMIAYHLHDLYNTNYGKQSDILIYR